MSNQTATADVNIHLRARAQDRSVIDRAAGLVEANRSQFMLASALKGAKNVLLDQTTVTLAAKGFQKVMNWLDAPAGEAESAGLQRLAKAIPPWRNG